MAYDVVHGVSLFTDQDIYLFREGTHSRLFDKLGSHQVKVDGVEGMLFAVWAPNALFVSVTGDFNGWNGESHPLSIRLDQSGVWEGFIPRLPPGQRYKYHIISRNNGYTVDKGDPFAYRWEEAPGTASITWGLDFSWSDREWMDRRRNINALSTPMTIYEVHLGSWRKAIESDGTVRFLSYVEIAEQLTKYVIEMGFTHVELMPVMEHPFYGSFGYQGTGYFAPTARYGTPQECMYLIDRLHSAGIGVILDWVPSHFPDDEHGLIFFDGTHLYEHADPRQGYHPDWKSYIFNYGRNEVRAFLASSAMFWLDRYHADGLRVDAVASMLYLDYSRQKGEWVPNIHGGRENLEAISFLRDLNQTVYRDVPGAQTIAEESTSWPMVSRPLYIGGLGFGMKWNMGWMHDMLEYFSSDPVFRKFIHNRITFSIWYAFTENFVLALSHDEVIHGKASLIGKMPGNEWQRFANLRALYGLMYGHPGKKLLFMGCEFGQYREWNHDRGLDWHLLQYPYHYGLKRWVADLNKIVRREPALHVQDFTSDGFEWSDFRDAEQSVISFLRKAGPEHEEDTVLVVCNFTPVPRVDYRIGVPRPGVWRELLNSDAEDYGGTGMGNLGGVLATEQRVHKFDYSLPLTLPPLSVLMFKPTEPAPKKNVTSAVEAALPAQTAKSAPAQEQRAGATETA